MDGASVIADAKDIDDDADDARPQIGREGAIAVRTGCATTSFAPGVFGAKEVVA